MNLVQSLVHLAVLLVDFNRFCKLDESVILRSIVLQLFNVLNLTIAWPIELV